MIVSRVCVLLIAVACAYAGSVAESRKARVLRLQNAVLAPCCYTEPVARHQSEIALKMRLEIERSVDQGVSDEEIVGRYVREYGPKILVDSRSRPQPWSIVAPWAVMALCAAGLSVLIWRWHRRIPPPSPAAADGPPLPDIPDDE